MKESTDRAIGVIDDQGTVVSCNKLTWIGEKWDGAASALAASESGILIFKEKTFKPLSSRNARFDYAAFVQGDDEQAKLICSMVTVALNGAKAYYEEKHDKKALVKSLISDNILLGDIYARAKELHFTSEATRAVFLVRQLGTADISAIDTVQSLFTDGQDDFVISINETDIAVIKLLGEGTDPRDLYQIAKNIEDALFRNLKIKCAVGIGTVVSHIRDLGKAYKEAGVAIEVGKVFDTEKAIINYENLGIGRLIYQLPTTLCGMFLQEVFKKNPIDSLDSETLFTINKFFENNLNVSETARKLFVHRNTLVYRLEKIKKLTGLDLREFDDAITFKVALMVKKYLVSRGVES
jgi:carbohydrate diacid regulator